MTKIDDVAHIRLGSSFRERIVHEPLGKFLVVQAKDISNDGALSIDDMLRVSDVPGKGAPDTLSEGELVFQTRGLSYRAAAVPHNAPPMVAAGSLFILRPDPERVITDYLVFFLNLPTTQVSLRQLATGSTIPNLRRSAIEQLELPLPNLPDQHRLVALSRLVRQQSDIETRLNALRLQELHLLAALRAEFAGGPKSKHSANKALKTKSNNSASQEQ